MDTYTPANSILFHGPITKLLSVLCSLVEVLSSAHGASVGRFSNDDAARTAVKGLRSKYLPGVLSVRDPRKRHTHLMNSSSQETVLNFAAFLMCAFNVRSAKIDVKSRAIFYFGVRRAALHACYGDTVANILVEFTLAHSRIG